MVDTLNFNRPTEKEGTKTKPMTLSIKTRTTKEENENSSEKFSNMGKFVHNHKILHSPSSKNDKSLIPADYMTV